jgi:hypothetical protein
MWGALVTGGMAAYSLASMATRGTEEGDEVAVVAIPILIGMGVGLGVLIDLGIKSTEVFYEAPRK